MAIIAKKAARIAFTELDIVSTDGTTLTKLVKDTTEKETVTLENQSRRVNPGHAGDFTISGSWQAFKTTRSRNGSLITYKCTKDAFSVFSAWTLSVSQ